METEKTPRITHNILVNGKKRSTHHITWINKPIPTTEYVKVMQIVKESKDYSVQGAEKIIELCSGTSTVPATITDSYSTPLRREQYVSLRNVLLKGKIISNYYRMSTIISAAAAKYAKHFGILELSSIYDFPPLNLLRGIFLARGDDPKKVYKWFTSRTTADMQPRDATQYKIAAENDAESLFNVLRIAEIAAQNEAIFVQMFTKLGIKYRTQDELTKDQLKIYGRAISTPDILFLDRVFINDVEVHWIDYKDYAGTSVNFIHQGNKRQVMKYTSEWGPGAICYRWSFIDGLDLRGAIALDGTAAADCGLI
jgi:hypothetical protein